MTMTIDTNAVVSMTEANRNFSKVTRLAEEKGQAVIFKNNRPKYMLIDLDTSPVVDMTDDEKKIYKKLQELEKRYNKFQPLENLFSYYLAINGKEI